MTHSHELISLIKTFNYTDRKRKPLISTCKKLCDKIKQTKHPTVCQTGGGKVSIML